MLRVTDVPLAASQARAACAGAVVLRVRDGLRPANDNVFALTASADGEVQCAPTDRPAQAQLCVGALCGLLLGAYDGQPEAAGQPDALRTLRSLYPPQRCHTFELC